MAEAEVELKRVTGSTEGECGRIEVKEKEKVRRGRCSSYVKGARQAQGRLGTWTVLAIVHVPLALHMTWTNYSSIGSVCLEHQGVKSLYEYLSLLAYMYMHPIAQLPPCAAAP